MSFKLFLYYSALSGAWAAFLTWALTAGLQGGGLVQHWFWATLVTALLLGMLLAAAIGLVDALVNAAGSQRTTRVLLCLVLGAVSGLVAGLVGGALLGVAHVLEEKASLPWFLEIPVYIVGWVVAGVLIGASVGTYDVVGAISAKKGVWGSLRRMRNGILGGFLGGLLGGVPFSILVGNRFLPQSSRAFSLVVLGLCIGFLIGLAQVILKEAWIKVEAGFRPGRELMLTKEEVTIGRAEACDLGLFGDNTIEKLHARILKKNNGYLLEDAGTEGGTFLNDHAVTKATPLSDGDTIRIGKSVLRFGERAKKK